MSESIKINTLPVARYMNVISDPPASEAEKDLSAQDKAILDKFREAAQSHPRYISDYVWKNFTWNSFIAILVMFQYLNDNKRNAERAMVLKGLFEGFKNDTKLNDSARTKNLPGNKIIDEWYPRNFIFMVNGDSYTEQRIFNKEMVDKQDYLGYAKLFNEILGGCNKDSTIESVIRRLAPYVLSDKQEAFQEIALVGFDVDFSTTREATEQDAFQAPEDSSSDAELSVTPKKLDGPLWKNCEKLYSAGARQIVFTGAPGTGKTYTAKAFAESVVKAYAKANGNSWGEKELEGHIRTVQFHSGYDYSDFVEGLRPAQTGENGKMTFVRLDGHFKEFCRKIVEAEDKKAPYFFIIDEINRADLSRVFGELMFCLDESKRPNVGKTGELVVTQYSKLPTYQIDESGKAVYLQKKDDVFRDGFFIPGNLCILATMNDIDRSVETFDFALRRRFKWIEADANAEMESGLRGMLENKVPDDQIKPLAEKVKAMNNVIFKEKHGEGETTEGKNTEGKNTEGKNTEHENYGGERLRLTRDYHIGHAYFEKYDGNNLQDIWDTQIEQILREYCRGRSNSFDVKNFIEYCRKALLGKYEDTK